MASRSAIGAALCVLLGCRHAPEPEGISAPEAAATAAADALGEAVARHHDTGAIDALRPRVDADPGHAGRPHATRAGRR